MDVAPCVEREKQQVEQKFFSIYYVRIKKNPIFAAMY
jgi:hypothetical protein